MDPSEQAPRDELDEPLTNSWNRPGWPSEQALPFFHEAAVDAVLVARYGYAGPWPGRRAAIRRDLTAALEALPPRSKAILALAALTDEERQTLVADVVGPRIDIRCGQCAGTGSDPRSNLDCTPCGATGYRVSGKPWREREARELAAEVLAALGLPVDEREGTG